MKILIYFKICIFLLSITTSLAHANEKLIGKALLEYSIFKIDIYEISYLRGPYGQEKLILDYKRNIKKKYSQEGWMVGLKPIIDKKNLNKKDYKWILDNTIDLKEGDKFSITKKDDHVILALNGRTIAEIKDKLIATLVFYPWLGESPIDNELKNKLLGKK